MFEGLQSLLVSPQLLLEGGQGDPGPRVGGGEGDNSCISLHSRCQFSQGVEALSVPQPHRSLHNHNHTPRRHAVESLINILMSSITFVELFINISTLLMTFVIKSQHYSFQCYFTVKCVFLKSVSLVNLLFNYVINRNDTNEMRPTVTFM